MKINNNAHHNASTTTSTFRTTLRTFVGVIGVRAQEELKAMK